MVGIARSGAALGDEAVLCRGALRHGPPEEGLGVIELLGTGHQAGAAVVRGIEPMSGGPSRRMSLTTGSPDRANC
jgi:hypothetical protein